MTDQERRFNALADVGVARNKIVADFERFAGRLPGVIEMLNDTAVTLSYVHKSLEMVISFHKKKAEE